MSLMADDSLKFVSDSLRSFPALSQDAPVLVAVSGGPDSVALAHLFSELHLDSEIAHFDHQTRNGGSAADASFVEELAGELGVRFHFASADIEAEAADSPMSFEEYAREARYTFLVETAKATGCCAIATGHHADDQAETVLMRVLRGTGPRGLAGIPPQGERGGVPIIRPLLGLRRDDLLAYLKERGYAYRHDETNLDTGYARNRIRHELLPHLSREYNPRLREALCRLADAQRVEDDLLSSLTRAFSADCVPERGIILRDAFAAGHPALQRRALLDFAESLGAGLDFDRVERAVTFILESETGKRFDLGGGVQLCAAKNSIEVVEIEADTGNSEVIPVMVPGNTLAFGKRLTIVEMTGPPPEPLSAYCTPTRQVIDASTLTGDLHIRHRLPGDRIAPLGLGGTRKLKDYFCDLGIPPVQRDAKLLLTAGNEVVWIVGHAVSAKAAVTEATTCWLEIEIFDEAQ